MPKKKKKKILAYDAIPKLTHRAGYRADVGWKHIDGFLENWAPVETEPDFQRAHVWDDVKRARYIEFVMRGGSSASDIYWNKPGRDELRQMEEPLTLVDGLQRLTAVRQFLADDLPIFPQNRFPWARRGGYVRSEIQYADCWFHSLTMHVNDLPTRAQVIQWYLDLNDGGVAHTTAELDRVRQLLAAEKE